MAFVVCPHHRTHELLTQPDRTSCGVTCCAMVLRAMGSPLANAVGLRLALGREASRDEDVATVLRTNGVPGAALHQGRSAAQLKALVRGTTATRPLIAAVIWEGENWGHWIVVAGRTTRGLGASSDYCVLDPEFGFSRTALSAGSVPIKFKTGNRPWAGLVYNANGQRGILKGTVITT